jgi:beta-galactosidase/beta-glucuronidase
VTSPSPVPLHPRPQLTRPGWTDLCGEWGFAYDDGNVGIGECWQDSPDVFDRQITVPYPPESELSGIGDASFHPVVWYRRTFSQQVRPDQRLLLHFGAVDYRAMVWVNGKLVAMHEGGHTPFYADVTSSLVEGDNVVVVRAEDLPHDLSQPRGKQDWELEPHAIWYRRTTGMWQQVWLETVPATHIVDVRWTPDLVRSTMGVGVRLHRTHPSRLRLRVRLDQHGENLADDTYEFVGNSLQREIGLYVDSTSEGRRERMWSPGHPNLIDATITLFDGDTLLDEVRSYTALRSIRAESGRILLNEQPYFLRLVLAQNFWPASHLAAPDEKALRQEVELVKELGFNGVRLHQKIEDPRFLYWCDVLGVLVWAEMPSAYEFSPIAVHRLTKEWLEVLARDYNHPCVIAWVPVNESWGVPALERSAPQRSFVRSLYHLTKALDPTRMVIGNDGWEQVITDVLTVHDYSGRGQTLRDRYGSYEALENTLHRVQPGYKRVLVSDAQRNKDEPIVLSEFGGITLNTDDGGAWLGYGAVKDADQLLRAYRGLLDAVLDSPALAGYCYTQLTDTLQEKNGLLDQDRQPKLDMSTVSQINRRTSAGVPADEITAFEFGDELIGERRRPD